MDGTPKLEVVETHKTTLSATVLNSNFSNCKMEPLASFGLQILVSGPDNPNVDIVAVHGLAAHPAYTWRKRVPDSLPSVRDATSIDDNNKVAEAHESGGVVWLTDLLPQDIPSARVLVFNYPSNYMKNTPKTTLRSIANRLCELLLEYRKTQKSDNRPIIFIGHSFGGIVVKEALVHANNDQSFKPLVLATSATVFLGTPHRGSPVTPWASMAVNCSRLFGLDSNNSLIHILREDSELLDNLLHDFTKLAFKLSITIVCFFEERDTQIKRKIIGHFIKTIVVSRDSATIDGCKAIGLDTNHSGLNKFNQATDVNYILLKSQLVLLVDTATEVIKNRISKQEVKYEKRKGLFIVPYQRNPNFVERESVVEEINTLVDKKVPGEQLRLSMHGLGGSGKTQLALNLVFNKRQDYNVFWVYGMSKANLLVEYAKIAREVGITIEGRTTTEICEDLKFWLGSDNLDDWILVVDSADDLNDEFVESIESVLPLHSGIILFTTRDGSIEGKLVPPNFCVQVSDEMTKDEALSTLKATIDSKLSIKKGFDEGNMLELLDELGFLPLAIVQATAHMNKLKTSPQDYLKRLMKNKAQLLSKPFYEVSQGQRAVMNTWQVSYDHIMEENILATKLLDVMSCLAYQEIQDSLFRPDGALDFIQDEFDIEEALELLISFAMVSEFETTQDERAYRMHKLVAFWTREHIDRNHLNQVMQSAYKVVFTTLQQYTKDKLLEYTNCLPHGNAVLDLYEKSPKQGADLTPQAIALHDKLGRYCLDVGDYPTARAHFSKCMSFWEKRNDESCRDPENVLSMIHNIGWIYHKESNYDLASQWSHRALKGREERLGKDATDTLLTVGNIALLYKDMGRYDQSLDWFKRSLTGLEAKLVPDDPLLLDLYNNMGLVYQEQGMYDEALKWLERALSGRLKVQDESHPDVLHVTKNIAGIYNCQGRYKEALASLEHVLMQQEQVLGKEHPDTLRTCTSIGHVYIGLCQWAEAEKYFERVLHGNENRFGADHSETARTLNNLAVTYDSLEQLDKALDCYKRALALEEKTLGKDHPSTLMAASNITVVYIKQGKYEEARKWCLVALEGRERVLGRDNPATIETTANMSGLFEVQGRYDEALEWCDRALSNCERVLGGDHPSTLQISYNKAIILEKLGRYQDALPIIEKVMERRMEKLGVDHKETIRAKENVEIAKKELNKGIKAGNSGV